MEITGNMETTETNMEEENKKELMCTNRYCYVHKVLQVMPEDREEICHNCGFDLKPWKATASG